MNKMFQIQSYMKEIEKPLARYKDDKDYNE